MKCSECHYNQTIHGGTLDGKQACMNKNSVCFMNTFDTVEASRIGCDRGEKDIQSPEE